MENVKNTPKNGQKSPKESRFKAVLGTLLDSSILLQGSRSAVVAKVAGVAVVILSAIAGVVEVFF